MAKQLILTLLVEDAAVHREGSYHLLLFEFLLSALHRATIGRKGWELRYIQLAAVSSDLLPVLSHRPVLAQRQGIFIFSVGINSCHVTQSMRPLYLNTLKWY